MVNDVIGGHVTSKFLKNLCKIFLFSSKNIRPHFFVKYVKIKHSFGPNGRKNHKNYRREAMWLRQLLPSLRYFVLSEPLHCAIIKFGNVIVSRLSIKFAFTLYFAITKFGNVIVSRLSLKFAFTLHCAIIKFGNVIVSQL